VKGNFGGEGKGTLEKIGLRASEREDKKGVGSRFIRSGRGQREKDSGKRGFGREG